MILNNVTTIADNGPVTLLLKSGKIIPVNGTVANTLQLTFNQDLVFPGLVNWHDHLDFNLFPQLGNQTYPNYTVWGNHIHRQYKSQIAAVLKVPLPLRVQWGQYKNLLCGVTTVVNHGQPLVIDNELLRVVQCHSLHSVQFDKLWRFKLNNPFKRHLPVVIHTGEGTDRSSRREIDSLIRWNLFKRQLIGIHGVAMTPQQAKSFGALIWCPWSNKFLLDKIAPVDVLKQSTKILFGTDSTLTGDWNIWNHIRLARQTHMLTDTELFKTLEYNNGWLRNDEDCASIVVAKRSAGLNGTETFFATNPADILLIIQNEDIKLFDETLLSQLKGFDTAGYSKIYLAGAAKYVKGDLPALMNEIKKHYPEAVFPVTNKPAA